MHNDYMTEKYGLQKYYLYVYYKANVMVINMFLCEFYSSRY